MASAEQEPKQEEMPEAEQAAAPEALESEQPNFEAEIASLKDKFMRAVAESENIRKRASKDVEDANKYAVTSFARDLVSVAENLAMASSSIAPAARAENPLLKTLGDGVDMTMQELLKTFERHGIRRIDPKGEKFDHRYHQAVSQVMDANQPPGTVAQVLQAGYTIHDRLLKPAMVVVTTEPEAPTPVDTTA